MLVAANADRGRDRRRARADLAAPRGGRVAVLRGERRGCSRGRWPRRSSPRPAALEATVTERLKRLGDGPTAEQQREADALERLGDLAERSLDEGSAKYDALVEHLQRDRRRRTGSPTRVVIFAERVRTLRWLQRAAAARTSGSSRRAGRVLHGGSATSSSRRSSSRSSRSRRPIRVLVTGDVASEGVNLHLQCHELVHYDIPWSLIRIEQRNGRIDRYGQKHRPRITTLLLDPTTERFAGDVRVLAPAGREGARGPQGARRQRLADGQVRRQGRGGRDPRGARRSQATSTTSSARSTRSPTGDGFDGLLARLFDAAATPRGRRAGAAPPRGRRRLRRRPRLPARRPASSPSRPRRAASQRGGVAWREHPRARARRVRAEPGPAAAARGAAADLPPERKVTEKLRLATTPARGKQALADAARRRVDVAVARGALPLPAAPGSTGRPTGRWQSLGRNEVFAVARRGRRGHCPAAARHADQRPRAGRRLDVPRRRGSPTRTTRRSSLPQPFAALREALDALGLRPSGDQHAALLAGRDRPRRVRRARRCGGRARRSTASFEAAAERTSTTGSTRWSRPGRRMGARGRTS